jgi:hypothetical protein
MKICLSVSIYVGDSRFRTQPKLCSSQASRIEYFTLRDHHVRLPRSRKGSRTTHYPEKVVTSISQAETQGFNSRTYVVSFQSSDEDDIVLQFRRTPLSVEHSVYARSLLGEMVPTINLLAVLPTPSEEMVYEMTRIAGVPLSLFIKQPVEDYVPLLPVSLNR